MCIIECVVNNAQKAIAGEIKLETHPKVFKENQI